MFMLFLLDPVIHMTGVTNWGGNDLTLWEVRKALVLGVGVTVE